MTKIKTNFINLELKRLEKYVQQLMSYLDKNSPDNAEDRIHTEISTRGNPIVKVISTKEQQVKAFSDVLEKLPKKLEELNRLRLIADTGEDIKENRGDLDRPGFMDEE